MHSHWWSSRTTASPSSSPQPFRSVCRAPRAMSAGESASGRLALSAAFLPSSRPPSWCLARSLWWGATSVRQGVVRQGVRLAGVRAPAGLGFQLLRAHVHRWRDRLASWPVRQLFVLLEDVRGLPRGVCPALRGPPRLMFPFDPHVFCPRTAVKIFRCSRGRRQQLSWCCV